MSPLTPKTAELNDRFRTSLNQPDFGRTEIRGQCVITPGIVALPPLARFAIIEKVRTFDTFTEENDPYGDHSFGAFEHPGVGKIFWKIDYYDPTLTWGVEDPNDLGNTVRVLTIMQAHEW